MVEFQPLDAAQLLQAFAQSAEFITDTAPAIVAYQNLEVPGTEPTTGSLYAIPVTGGVTTYTIELGQAAVDYTISGTLGGSPITGTLSSGSGLAPITGTSNIVINAPYGLNDFQSINLSGINNVLNANYTGGASQTGLNIQGVQTWNINAAGPEAAGYSGYPAGETPEVISFSGDAAEGNVISGLTTVNFNDNSSDNTLLIGDNSEPVQEPNGANGFTINVSNAVGYAIPGSSGALINGVDVDIAAQAFTGKDTINVSAYIVGGFPQLNGSYQVPALETGFSGDPDNYNPNWSGFLKDAFGISAGASASSLTTLNGVTLPPTGAVGFQTWDIYSAGAKSVGSVNILALGNEGSWNATTINLTDDGSTTFLFATALSDSLTTDWQNIQTINLSGTSGQVIITGAETDAQEFELPGRRRRRLADLRHHGPGDDQGRHGQQLLRFVEPHPRGDPGLQGRRELRRRPRHQRQQRDRVQQLRRGQRERHECWHRRQHLEYPGARRHRRPHPERWRRH